MRSGRVQGKKLIRAASNQAALTGSLLCGWCMGFHTGKAALSVAPPEPQRRFLATNVGLHDLTVRRGNGETNRLKSGAENCRFTQRARYRATKFEPGKQEVKSISACG